MLGRASAVLMVLVGVAHADAPTVTKPGRDPHLLRLAPKQGDHHALTMTVASERQQRNLKGVLLPAEKQPAMKTVMDYTVAKVDADGTTTIDVAYHGIDAPGAPPETQKVFASLAGMRGHFTLRSNGEPVDMALEMPAGATPQLRALANSTKQSLTQLAERFPDTPVGVGGVWVTKSTVKTGEIEATTTTTHELVQVAAGVATIHLTLVIAGKNVGTGSKVALAGKATGDSKIDLASGMPLSGKLELGQDIDVETGDVRLSQHVTMRMTVQRD